MSVLALCCWAAMPLGEACRSADEQQERVSRFCTSTGVSLRKVLYSLLNRIGMFEKPDRSVSRANLRCVLDLSGYWPDLESASQALRRVGLNRGFESRMYFVLFRTLTSSSLFLLKHIAQLAKAYRRKF